MSKILNGGTSLKQVSSTKPIFNSITSEIGPEDVVNSVRMNTLGYKSLSQCNIPGNVNGPSFGTKGMMNINVPVYCNKDQRKRSFIASFKTCMTRLHSLVYYTKFV